MVSYAVKRAKTANLADRQTSPLASGQTLLQHREQPSSVADLTRPGGYKVEKWVYIDIIKVNTSIKSYDGNLGTLW